jgi:hypothetical protein
MYSGSTITKISGIVLGAHQKIDRVARKQLDNLIPENNFPKITDILKFEGDRGPDSMKRKSPFKDEPWHFFNPEDEEDISILVQINHHYSELVKALREDNNVKSSFESAWLAHAIVDGLTPAHHNHFSEESKKLRGQDKDRELTPKDKLLMHGDTKKEKIINNWRMWGPQGLLTYHLKFELGFASLIAPLKFTGIIPKKRSLKFMSTKDINKWYRELAKDVVKLNLYEDFIDQGWTIKLSQKAQKKLAPMLINAVTRIWYNAYLESVHQEVKNKK